MKERILKLCDKVEKLSEELSDPSIFNDQQHYKKISMEHNEISNILDVGEPYLKALSDYEGNLSILKENEDPELVELAEMENEDLKEQIDKYEDKLKQLLIPKHPDDYKNAIMEIRAGTGGDEAGLFAGDLYRMFMHYCDDQEFKTDIMNSNPSERGGFKEIIISITGQNAYGTLKYESGVHRVQRVPDTETQGRVHTSAVSVVVLPEAEEVDIKIEPNELRVDVYRSSGPGGQSVNTTDSAVRITHIPTGIVVSCQDEKSQLKNKNKAMKVLRSRIVDQAVSEHNSAIAAQRKSIVGTGDRSAKIRTYNYPQGRVTDHRIGLTLYKLDRVLEGDIAELINALKTAEKEELLKSEI